MSAGRVTRWLAAVLLGAGCSSGAATNVGQTQGAATADALQADGTAGDSQAETHTADVAVPMPCETTPSLASLENTYFANSCAFSSCHTTKKPAGGLDLTPGHAFAHLVGVPAFDPGAAKAGLKRVVPSHPEQSFLYEKVHGPTKFGVLMPLGTPEVVDPDCGVKALKQWIEAGALDD